MTILSETLDNKSSSDIIGLQFDGSVLKPCLNRDFGFAVLQALAKIVNAIQRLHTSLITKIHLPSLKKNVSEI